MTDTACTIRKAEPRDLEALTELMRQYIVDFYQCPMPPVERVHGLIRMCLEGRDGQQFVAETGGELVGFATMYFTYSTLRATRVGIMNDLYVAGPARGTGVAAGLFNQCRRHAEALDLGTMQWETAHDNHRAQRFYEKMGGQKGDWLAYSI